MLFHEVNYLCVFSNHSFVSVFACSCAWEIPEHFCRTVQESDYNVLAVVTEKTEWLTMDIKVLDIINQNVEDENITVLGRDGFNYSVWLEDDFIVGDTMIISLLTGEFGNAENDSTHIWFIYFCGLNYSNGMVTGNIDFDISEQPHDDFKDEIPNCIDLSSLTV